jgi:hypothetical protein
VRVQSDGIVPRIIAEIFSAIEAAPANMQFTVKVSYVEVYLEKIRDLFDPRKDHLRIREDPRRGVWLEDVTEIFVGSRVRCCLVCLFVCLLWSRGAFVEPVQVHLIEFRGI